MTMHLPTDLEALVQKRLATGAYSSAEEVIRHALEAQETEDTWSVEERQALDVKIDRALEQISMGSAYGPKEARQRLSAMRAAHLANPSR